MAPAAAAAPGKLCGSEWLRLRLRLHTPASYHLPQIMSKVKARINGLTAGTSTFWLYFTRNVYVPFVMRIRRINELSAGAYAFRPSVPAVSAEFVPELKPGVVSQWVADVPPRRP